MRNVLSFYKNVGWKNKDQITYDSRLFEDNRKYSANYVSMCRKRIQKYIPKKGNHFLDFASGPLQYPEYIKYSKNFKTRKKLPEMIVTFEKELYSGWWGATISKEVSFPSDEELSNYSGMSMKWHNLSMVPRTIF